MSSEEVQPEEEEPLRWQPVALITNRRLECKCGALAVFVTGRLSGNPDDYNELEDVDVWCQPCFGEAQRKEREKA